MDQGTIRAVRDDPVRIEIQQGGGLRALAQIFERPVARISQRKPIKRSDDQIVDLYQAHRAKLLQACIGRMGLYLLETAVLRQQDQITIEILDERRQISRREDRGQGPVEQRAYIRLSPSERDQPDPLHP
jgi:hypothetical protein